MMGRVSAWSAVPIGLVFALLAAVQGSFGMAGPALALALAAVLLFVGAFRTLRRVSGGLRLLCGAWGLAAGIFLAPGAIDISSDGLALMAPLSLVIVALPLIALAGLALAVLHKEQK